MDIAAFALNNGAFSARVISPSDVYTAPWPSEKCREGCEAYGKTLACPPYVPAFEETRKKLDSYKSILLFSCGGIDDVSFIARKCREELLKNGFSRAYAYGGGPCRVCAECDRKNCRHPELLLLSFDGCGIDVFGTLEHLGIDAGKNCFGLVLVE